MAATTSTFNRYSLVAHQKKTITTGNLKLICSLNKFFAKFYAFNYSQTTTLNCIMHYVSWQNIMISPNKYWIVVNQIIHWINKWIKVVVNMFRNVTLLVLNKFFFSILFQIIISKTPRQLYWVSKGSSE